MNKEIQTDNVGSNFKYKRILNLYTKLLNGEIINKAKAAADFHVTERSIQRDLDDLRVFFDEQTTNEKNCYKLVYNRKEHGYFLQTKNIPVFTNKEVFAICKILLESQAFRKDELEPIIQKLINSSIPQENHSDINELLSKELFYYIEPQHKQECIEKLWNLAMAVNDRHMIKISYEKQNGAIIKRKIKPVGIMFSDFYFYMPAFITDADKETVFHKAEDLIPVMYRIDHIHSFEVLTETFESPYNKSFDEGDFRKRVPFMCGGHLKSIRFIYKENNIEDVLDRLPSAQILAKRPEGYLIYVEIFGNGIDMWLRSQGDRVKIVN